MADESTVASNASPPKVKGKFQLSQEQYEELKATHDGLETLVVGVPHIGVVVLIPASRGDQRRFMDKTMGNQKTVERTKRFEAFEELARVSLAWPTVDELDAEIETKRKYMAWIELGTHAAKLAGLNTDELEGN